MSLAQEIILYFEIIPIITFLLYAVIKSYIEEKEALKKQNRKLKIRYKNILKQLDYEEYKLENKRQFLNCVIK